MGDIIVCMRSPNVKRSFPRWLGLLIAVLAVLLGLTFNWSRVLAAGYTRLSAYHLAQALVGHSHNSSHLQRSWAFALKALQLQPQSKAAARLALRALAEDIRLPGAESIQPSKLAEGADVLSVLYAGLVLWHSGDRQRAIELWRSGKGIGYYFMYLGDQAYDQGDVHLALSYYEMSHAIDDALDARKLRMYRNRCAYEIRQQDAAEAIFWCTRATQVHKTVWTLLALGQAFYTAGDYRAALSALEQARSLNPRVANVHYYLGLTYQRLGQAELAQDAYQQGLKLSPSHQYLNWAAGRLYEQMGQLPEAYCCYLRVTRGSNQTLKKSASDALQRLSASVPTPVCDSR